MVEGGAAEGRGGPAAKQACHEETALFAGCSWHDWRQIRNAVERSGGDSDLRLETALWLQPIPQQDHRSPGAAPPSPAAPDQGYLQVYPNTA